MKRNPDPTQNPPTGSEIDWTDPIHEGLVGCWLLNEGAGAGIQDIVSRVLGTHNCLSIGGGLSFAAASANVGFLGVNYDGWVAQELTIIISCQPANWTQVAGLVNKRTAYDASAAYSFGLNYSSSNRLYLDLPYSSPLSRPFYYCSTSGWTTDRPVRVATVYNGAWPQNARVIMYRDGVAQNTISAYADTAVSIVHVSNSVLLGRVNEAGTLYYSGTISDVKIYSRALSASEVAQLYAEPYGGILVPGLPKWYSIPAGGTLYERTAAAGIGSGAVGGRVYAAIRPATAGVAGNAAGARILSTFRGATADVTSGASGGRVFGANRTGAAGIGTAGTAGRVLGVIRAATAGIGASGAAGRLLAAIRSAAGGVGTNAGGGRVLGAIRSGVAGVGTAASASRVFAAIRAASAGIGVHAVRTVAAAGRYLIVRFNRLFGRGIGP